ncbi:enoyl-CoA hydratase/isomerase family protein [Glaciihabitans sp. INWT7]|uniref:enoyl-CoA hydratase/isomerase family protein n=1 Tax=Glaciihabitans sp. INWT7 TaxID=2596912 RepID=UPI00162A826E|nr:enoyl-CoA hydratase/isomerase family protein [Glaciihabitans sp. INWT7]QNE47200.1 enoyl-CoA hydratase/isomerase family protein [Glaciihabitans sp. INWT7]
MGPETIGPETSNHEDVLVERRGRLGHIVLNRPKAINALTHGMVKTIAATLERWEHDDSVSTVLITGAGERGLCAGGDIVAIYTDAKAGGNDSARFWADEYALNAHIARYSKPYVAVMDGVVLGGGVGVSAHGSVRVVTERSRVGMPETGIGFVPDVGGTFLLSRAPGELGTHLGLTAGPVTGADAIAIGLADHFVPSEALAGLAIALETRDVAEAIAAVATAAPVSALLEQRHWIDDCYASDDATEIVERLSASPVEAARAAASAILAKSPTAVSVTLESLRRARALGTLEEVLDQEFRVSVRFARGTELVEGVRAQVIDKDRTPHWSPPALADVSRSAIEAYFAGLDGSDPPLRELGLSSMTAEQDRRTP